MPGYALEMVPGLARLGGWAHRVEDAARTRRSYGDLVEQLRSGAPRWSPLTWPGLDQFEARVRRGRARDRRKIGCRSLYGRQGDGRRANRLDPVWRGERQRSLLCRGRRRHLIRG